MEAAFIAVCDVMTILSVAFCLVMVPSIIKAFLLMRRLSKELGKMETDYDRKMKEKNHD